MSENLAAMRAVDDRGIYVDRLLALRVESLNAIQQVQLEVIGKQRERYMKKAVEFDTLSDSYDDIVEEKERLIEDHEYELEALHNQRQKDCPNSELFDRIEKASAYWKKKYEEEQRAHIKTWDEKDDILRKTSHSKNVFKRWAAEYIFDFEPENVDGDIVWHM